MTNRQYEVFEEVLRRLHDSKVLKDIVLVGSWCLLIYRKYFPDDNLFSMVRTRDVDFLIPLPPRFSQPADIPELLKDLGFILGHRGEEGYMVLQHPELLVEFLTTERGRGSDGAYDLPALGVNAQPLRFMDLALMNTIEIAYESIPVTVPHPAAFALHKLLVAPRRTNDAHRKKDIAAGITVMHAVVKKSDDAFIKELTGRIPASWCKTIAKVLRNQQEEEMVQYLA